MAKRTVDIPPDLWKEIKLLCVKQNKRLSDWVREALEDKLANPTQQKGRGAKEDSA